MRLLYYGKAAGPISTACIYISINWQIFPFSFCLFILDHRLQYLVLMMHSTQHLLFKNPQSAIWRIFSKKRNLKYWFWTHYCQSTLTLYNHKKIENLHDKIEKDNVLNQHVLMVGHLCCSSYVCCYHYQAAAEEEDWCWLEIQNWARLWAACTRQRVKRLGLVVSNISGHSTTLQIRLAVMIGAVIVW